jgi:hypothetical protein
MGVRISPYGLKLNRKVVKMKRPWTIDKTNLANLASFSEKEVQKALNNNMCPFCSKGPFKSVTHHIKYHGVTAKQLRDYFGWIYNHSLCSSEMSEIRSNQAKELLKLGILTPGLKGKKIPKKRTISLEGKRLLSSRSSTTEAKECFKRSMSKVDRKAQANKNTSAQVEARKKGLEEAASWRKENPGYVEQTILKFIASGKAKAVISIPGGLSIRSFRSGIRQFLKRNLDRYEHICLAQYKNEIWLGNKLIDPNVHVGYVRNTTKVFGPYTKKGTSYQYVQIVYPDKSKKGVSLVKYLANEEYYKNW